MLKEQHHEGDFSHGHWVEINDFHSAHEQSPAHEYASYGFVSTQHHGLPLESTYRRSMPPLYSGPQHPQPLFTAQWPSMLTNPSSQGPPTMPVPAPPLAPVSTFATAHPLPPLTTPASVSAPAPPPAPTTQRRTLTDQDRRRMCQYHEDHPNVKQTEIGGKPTLRANLGVYFTNAGNQRCLESREGQFLRLDLSNKSCDYAH